MFPENSTDFERVLNPIAISIYPILRSIEIYQHHDTDPYLTSMVYWLPDGPNNHIVIPMIFQHMISL